MANKYVFDSNLLQKEKVLSFAMMFFFFFCSRFLVEATMFYAAWHGGGRINEDKGRRIKKRIRDPWLIENHLDGSITNANCI